MKAIYDLTKMPTTFDFAAWCVIAKTAGCDHVHFIADGPIASKKYPKDIAWRRWANICLPMCKLAGMEFSVGGHEEGREFTYAYGHVEQVYKHIGRIAKLQSVYDHGDSGYITITLRESFRNTYRNSNKEAWNRFAEYLKKRGKRVMVLHDCESAPLNLEYRMALYCGAEMNLGASNGPMALCHFSDAPYITLNMAPKRPEGERGYDLEKLMTSGGFPFGSQFSFRNADQILVWKPDTYENIVEAYEAITQERAAA